MRPIQTQPEAKKVFRNSIKNFGKAPPTPNYNHCFSAPCHSLQFLIAL